MASLDDNGQVNPGEQTGAEQAPESSVARFERLPDPWQESRELGSEPAPPAPSDNLDAILADLRQWLAQPPAAPSSDVPPIAERDEPPPAAAQSAKPPASSEASPLPIAERQSEPAAETEPVAETEAGLGGDRSEADALLEQLQVLAVDALSRQPLKPATASESSLELTEPGAAAASAAAEVSAVEAAAPEPPPESAEPEEPTPVAPVAREEPPAPPSPPSVAPCEPAEPEVSASEERESAWTVGDPAAMVPADRLASEAPAAAESEPSNGAAAPEATNGSAAGSPGPSLFRFGDRDYDPLEVLRELLLSPEPGVSAAAASAPPPAKPRRRPPPPPAPLQRPPRRSSPPAAVAPPAPAVALPPDPPASAPPAPEASKNSPSAPAPPAVTAAGKAVPSVQEVEATYLRQLIGDLETKLGELEKQVYQPTEVINPLLPLIVQLMKLKVGVTEEAVYRAAVPAIDRIIRDRAEQDREAMSDALAELIPSAIAQEVKRSPDTIAKALGPEMAAAISEQIKLQKDAISKALGPEMGRAIKAQIEIERDAMVDALYPVIGNTIAKYMGEVVAQINEKVETALSPAGLQRKLRAKLQGVSEAELILQESMPTAVQAMFLIHKASGLAISEIQPEEARLEPNMIAGMLTAIRSFVNDCIAQSGEISELNEIEYGDSRIILEVAGYCYLAVVVQGTPRQVFIKRMRRVLAQLIRKYSREIEEFDGDRSTIPPELHRELAVLAESDIMTPDGKPRRRSRALLWLILAILALFLIPWSFFQVRGFFARRLETKIETALADLDDRAYTTLEAEVKGNRVLLRGRVSSQEVSDEAAQMVAGLAPKRQLDNQILVVRDSSAAAAAVQLMAAALNRDPNVELTAEYQSGTAVLRGQFGAAADRQQLIDSFRQLPGVEQVEARELVPAALQERIYFDLNSATLKETDRTGKLAAIGEFLEASPEVELKIVGHSDEQGTREVNEVLAQERAAAVRDALAEQGIDPDRLQIEGVPGPPADLSPEAPQWQSRCVRFELVLPGA